jgi:TP901 family phage tail tape measure protein
MSGAFAKLETQVGALNAQLAQMVALQNGVDATGYNRMTQAAARASNTFRSAAASTGMFEVQQMRLNSAADEYIKKLDKQQMSFRRLWKERQIAATAYKKQLAMENMSIYDRAGGTSNGRRMADVVVPREVSAEMDTAGKRLAFMNHQLKSGAHQMVNWGKNTQWAGRQLTVGLTMPVIAFGAAAGVMAYQIDKELTRVAKVYDTTADATSSSTSEMMKVEQELQALREAGTATAIKAAREYGSVATETLQVQAELAATGQRGADLQKNTAEVMRIARLGEVDHQEAIKATISLQSVFRMSTEQLTEAFNYMNSVENATSLATADFAAAIPIAAAPVKQFGGDIEELGILLTAMKERGIEATQGANAIKAAMQRLGRPSKQIQEEWTALTGTDITKLFDESESLIDLFTRIREATVGLDNKEQIKAFAGLFGTYQVTRMSALVEGMDDLKNGTGQVSDAFKIAQQSSSEWAETADREMKRYQESISGQWDTAFQEMKVQLSTMGEPFVEMATIVVRGVSDIIGWFNELPGAVKKGVAGLIGLAALAGPILMLSGLMGNLFGNALKGAAALIGLGAKMNIVDAESRAAALAAKLVDAGFVSNRTQAQQLTAELGKLAQAHNAAAVSARNYATAAGMPVAPMAAQTAAASQRTMLSTPLMGGGAYAPVITPPKTPGYMHHGALIVDKEKVALVKAENAERSKTIDKQIQSAVYSKQATEEQKKMNKAALATGAATVAMAAGMALTLGTANEAAGAIGNFLIIGSMVVPAIALMGKGLKVAATWAKAQAIAMWASAAASMATGDGMKGLASRGKGALSVLTSMAGKAGIVGAVLVAAGAGIYALTKHLNKLSAEELRLHNSVNSMTDTWAEGVGKVRLEYNKLQVAQKKVVETAKEASLIEQYSSGDMRGVVDDFSNTEFNADDRDRLAAQHYMELQVEYGLSSVEAARNLKAMFIAAGYGAAEVNSKVLEITSSVDKLSRKDLGPWLKNQVDIFKSENVFSAEAEAAGKDVGLAFAQGIDSANANVSQQLVKSITDAAMGGWDESFKMLSQSYEKELASLGINSAAALRKAMEKPGADLGKMLLGAGVTVRNDDAFIKAINDRVSAARNAEKNIITSASKSSTAFGNAVDDNVDSISKLAANWIVYSKQLNFRDAVKEAKNLAKFTSLLGGNLFGNFAPSNPLDGMLADIKLIDEETARTRVNQMNLNFGYKEGETLQEAIFNLQNKIKNETKNTDAATKQWAGSLSFAKDQMASMRMDAMSAVQNDIADDYRTAFDNQMNSALDARQDYWDGRQEALSREMDQRSEALDRQQESASLQLDRQHERQVQAIEKRHDMQQRALDVRWENRMKAAEDYWERRVEGVEKAIEAEERADEKRQNMFDAEIARINKLNDMANRKIDFNIALNSGDLDEAARIRNDAMAEDAQYILEAAAQRGSKQSAKRINKLEGRRDALVEAEERHMDSLQKQEERERRSLQIRQEQERRSLDRRHEMQQRALERTQEAQRKHLEKMTEMQEKALDQQAENDMETQRRIWEARKESLEDQLDLFLSFIARNEKELKKHMKNVGLSYHDFGEKVLKPKGDNWAKYFGERMKKHIREAGLKLASDNMWEKLGKNSMEGTLKGMGFSSKRQLMHFIKTGEMKSFPGSSSGTKGGNKKGGSPIQSTDRRGPGLDAAGIGGRHEGGIVDSSKGSRKGVARTQKGLHPSEQMILAQKGEFVVNRKDAQRNMDVLSRINRGEAMGDTGKTHGTPRYRRGGKGGPGVLSGVAGLAAGIANVGLMKGASTGITEMYNRKKAEYAAINAMYAAGKGGMFGDRAFTAEHLRNAAIIANVGSSMGMSARDIMIGIMTAITESGLVNVNFGDRDSLGLFQQRPSMGWGTEAQVTDPEYAARAFFGPLKAHGERNDEAPWLAAQHIQRSAFSDGSNYRVHWDSAKAIFRNGLHRTKNGGFSPMTYAAGKGGWHRPMKTGTFGSSTHDIGVPVGTPVYAIGNGRITSSRYVTTGGSPAHSSSYPKIAPNGQRYRSYGETMTLTLPGGTDINYAHLKPGSRIGTGPVKGGAQIAQSGNTGNSSGPHLHIDINGNEIASSWLASRGIGMKVGGNIHADGVPAILHKNETVLTSPLSKDLYAGLGNLTELDAMAASTNALTRSIRNFIEHGPTRPDGKPDKDRPGKGNKPGKGNGKDPEGNGQVAGRGGQIKIGTYNVKHSTGMSRNKADLDRIMRTVDSVSLQEMMFSKGKALTKYMNSKGWGTYYPQNKTTGDDSAIAWNASKYQALQKDFINMNTKNFSGYRTKKSQTAPHVLLRDKESGRRFWHLGAHTVVRGYSKNQRVMAEQYASLRRLWDRLDNTAPVIMGGDMNNPRPVGDLKIPGLKKAHQIGIDAILYGKGTRLINSTRVAGQGFGKNGGGGGPMASDHPFLWSTLQLTQPKGLNVGGYTVSDGLAQLHKNELVVDPARTKMLLEGVENFANGGNNTYNVNVDARGTDVSADDIANKVIYTLKREERRKPQSRRAGNGMAR